MAVVEDLSEEECYLLSLMLDKSGIDLAEFLWTDETNRDGVFRCYDFQYPWYRTHDKFQIDQAARSVGKSLGIQMRAFAFPFHSPGEEMLLTAPEMIHLNPITEKVADRILDTRISHELLKRRGASNGITHRPFEAKFVNGARIIGRIPQKDGKGVKGQHPKQLEMDEAQDYPECFPEGTLVLTRSGYRKIEAIREGDEVFTHRRRWRKVTSTAMRVRDTVRVVGQGHPGMVVSSRHRFYAIREQEGRVFGGRSVDGHPLLTPVLTFSRPEWVEARGMVGSWWSTPARFPKVSTPPSAVHVGGRREGMGWSEDGPNTLWLLGLYLADGSIGFRDDVARSVTFTVHIDEEDEVLRHCELAGFVPAASRQVGGSEKCVGITLNDPRFASWLLRHCGHGAYEKQVPVWVYGLRSDWRRAVLAGALFGDGCDVNDGRYQDGRWKFSTVGKAQAAAIKTLATTLGYVTSWYWVQDADEREIRGRRFRLRDGGWYQVVGSPSGQAFDHDLLRYQRVRTVRPGEPQVTLYDLGVEEDESFVVEGVVVHNSGWVELGETLKYGNEDAIWRAHGVSRGVRDRFYKQTQPNSGWRVHRITAMHRGDWGQAERESKAELYGSRDHPDYRRNILGMHGDAQSALFVLSRLMQCVDAIQSSDYNEREYYHLRITEEKLKDSGLPVEALLRLPGRHKQYGVTWAGMDIGLTNHPSEILVFGETTPARSSKKSDETSLKLLTRIHLERISAPDQRRVMEEVYDHYRPRGFAMDRTGLGLPIYQEIMADGGAAFQNSIRPFNFSEKIVVGYEHEEQDEETWWEESEPEEILANVLEYSSDMLRLLVDTERLVLPWDVELLREFQGQTYQVSKSSTNPYGRKVFSQGQYHALDAARMAALAFFHDQVRLDEARGSEPVLDSML